ncbi:MAG TPA: copper-binding protein [Burkholderiaceae bacterium]|nr:copper-binding protein [Burkholderiaceae bacterium]
MTKVLNLLMAALIAAAPLARAQTAPGAPTATAAAKSDGEVRKIDKDAGKLTLKHGPIANLEMPGMTMVFRVADPKMLEGLKEGDRVRFSADRVNGAITITAIDAVR